jgi:hypothetical protein
MPFKPGQSGNPAGKPLGTGHVERCKKWAEQKGWGILEKLAQSDDPKIMLEATKLLLAYGVGRPVEHKAHTGSLTLEQLLGHWDQPKDATIDTHG